MLRATLLTVTLAAAAWTAVPATALACDGTSCAAKKAAHQTAEKKAVPDATKATAVLTVSGMSCGNCAQRVTAALMGLDGVGEAKVDHKEGKAVVVYDSAKVKPEALVQAVSGLGYSAALAPSQKET